MDEPTAGHLEGATRSGSTRDRHPHQRAGVERRAAIAAFIEEHLHDQGVPPTRQEIAVGVGSTPATAYHHINIMLREGRLRDAGGPRGLTTVDR